MIAELLTLMAGSWAVVTVWERWDRHRAWRRHADQAIALTGPRGPEDDPATMYRIADLAADLAFEREAQDRPVPQTILCLVCDMWVWVADMPAHSRYFHGGRL